ncbi:hypothetical protein KP509_13G008800 [Ceratopteris richardii]|uniref:MAR-binding filament-like protein 1-1 n=2 Tax=Ceratopteris richardii TaxID=49495 RepID=A0A8T2TB78_CERRI|nr:hypothetical protein KP509_13G008800 [Ceratopteris richardii]
MAAPVSTQLSFDAAPECLQKYSFSGGELRQFTLSQVYARSRLRRWERASTSAGSSPDSSFSPSAPTRSRQASLHKTIPCDKSATVSRRAFTALFGIVSHTVIVSKSRADGEMLNESERMRLEMIQKLEEKSKDPSVEGNKQTMGAAETMKEPRTVSDDLLPGETESSSNPRLIPAVTEPSSKEDAPQIQDKNITVQGAGGSVNFLGTLSWIGSGVLGGMYWLERQAKESADMSLQNMTVELKAKEDAMNSLREQLEGDLSHAKELALQQSKKSKQEIEALMNDISSAKSIAETLERELTTEKLVSENLGKQIKSLQLVLEETQKQKETLESKIIEEENRGVQLEEDKKRINSELEKRLVERDTLRLALKEREKAFEDLESLLTVKLEALSQAESKIDELMKEVCSLKEKVSSSQNNVDYLEGELASANAHGQHLEQKLISMTEEFDSFKKASALEVASLQLELDSKDAEVNDLKHELDTTINHSNELKKTISNLHGEIDTLEKQINESNVVIKELQRDLEARFKEINTSKSQISCLEEDLRIAKENNRELQEKSSEAEKKAESKLNSLKETLEHEQTVVNKLSKELEKAKHDLGISKDEVSLRKHQLGELEGLQDKLKKDLNESESYVKSLETALENEKEISASNKRQLDSARKSITEAKDHIKLLRKDVAKAKSESERLMKEVKDLEIKLGTEVKKVTELEAEKKSLNLSLNEEREVTAKLKHKVEQMDSALGKLSRDRDSSLNRVKRLEGELAATKGEMLRLQKQAVVVDGALKDAKSRVQKVSEMKQSDEQASNAARIATEITNLQGELSDVGKGLETAEKTQEEAEVAVGSLREVVRPDGTVE